MNIQQLSLLSAASLALLPSACRESADQEKTPAAGAPEERADGAPAPAPPEATDQAEKKAAKQAGAEAEGPRYGRIRLAYGDETVEIETLREQGTNLMFAAGTVSLSLMGPDGEKISISYQAKDGTPLTGEFAPPASGGVESGARMAQVSVMDFIGPEPAIRLKEGSVTISRCDEEGHFTAEFSGEAASMNPTVEGTKPFSGRIEVKVPVQKY